MNLAEDPTYKLAPLMWVCIVVFYIILPVFLTQMIFRRKELEF